MKDRTGTPMDASCVHCITKVMIEILKPVSNWEELTCDYCSNVGLKELPWSEL